jgi:hypothetical protein
VEKYLSNQEPKKLDYIVEGLNKADYQLFKEVLFLNTMKLLNFTNQNFHQSLYYYIPLFNRLIGKLIISDTKYQKIFENYFEILKYFKLIVQNYSSLIYDGVEDIIYKYSINNFIDIFVILLERKDKTVTKIDNNYFRLSNTKTKRAGNKSTPSMSLIQKAKQDEGYDKFLNGYNDNQIEKLLISYIEIHF